MCGFNNFKNQLQGLYKDIFILPHIQRENRCVFFSKNHVPYFCYKNVFGDAPLKNSYATTCHPGL